MIGVTHCSKRVYTNVTLLEIVVGYTTQTQPRSAEMPRFLAVEVFVHVLMPFFQRGFRVVVPETLDTIAELLLSN
jgi:hypothetical protein